MDEPIRFEDFGGQGPLLHFAHPNAYPPACFQAMLEPLTADYHVIAMHHRPLWPGHEPDEFEDWQLIADDLSRFLRQQKVEQIVGVGHSLGAVATMMVAWQQPQLFRALVLIEPVFFVPQVLDALAANPQWASYSPMVRTAQNRRSHWPNRQAAFDHFRAKKVFDRWSDDALWHYINGALVETSDGQVTLLFRREWEAQIYASLPQRVWEELPRVTQPTLAVRGAQSDTLSGEAWALWQQVQPQATFVEVSEAGHLVPLERPGEVVRLMTNFLEREA